jgi:hypothetical protein
MQKKFKSIQRYLAPMAISADYSIMGWDGEKLKEGELRTTREDFEEFLRSSAGACGDGSRSHSPSAGCGSGFGGTRCLVANLRKLEEPTTGLMGFAPTVVPAKHSGS